MARRGFEAFTWDNILKWDVSWRLKAYFGEHGNNISRECIITSHPPVEPLMRLARAAGALRTLACK